MHIAVSSSAHSKRMPHDNSRGQNYRQNRNQKSSEIARKNNETRRLQLYPNKKEYTHEKTYQEQEGSNYILYRPANTTVNDITLARKRLHNRKCDPVIWKIIYLFHRFHLFQTKQKCLVRQFNSFLHIEYRISAANSFLRIFRCGSSLRGIFRSMRCILLFWTSGDCAYSLQTHAGSV